MHFIVSAERKLFVGFAFLNTVGYNSENGWFYSELRRDVRLRLAGRDSYWRSELIRAGLLEPFLRAGGAMLMDTLPFLAFPGENPPAYGECLVGWQQQSRIVLKEAGHWLERFYIEEKIEGLWMKWRASYEEANRELEKIVPALEIIAKKINCDFDNIAGESATAERALTVMLMPNLLDAGGRGYSVSSQERTWLHFGPFTNAKELEARAVHEFLHREVDPEADRISGNFEDEGLMQRARAEFRIVAESYPELPIWIGETTVRAATAWLVPHWWTSECKDRKDLVSFHEQMGFIGFEDAYSFLENRSERSFKESLSDALQLVYERVRGRN